MGTNYYVRTSPCENACEHCSAARDIHLGKSSHGWTFTFRAYPDTTETGVSEIGPVVMDFASWKSLLDLGTIRDEYGVELTRADLLAKIEVKRGTHNSLYGSDFHDADGNRFVAVDFC